LRHAFAFLVGRAVEADDELGRREACLTAEEDWRMVACILRYNRTNGWYISTERMKQLLATLGRHRPGEALTFALPDTFALASDVTDYVLLEADYTPGDTHPVMNFQVLHAAEHGRQANRPNIQEITATRVILEHRCTGASTSSALSSVQTLHIATHPSTCAGGRTKSMFDYKRDVCNCGGAKKVRA
jgi:hypothetical protein